MKKLVLLILTYFLSHRSDAWASEQLSDILLSSNKLSATLTKFDVKNSDARTIAKYTATSLHSLSTKKLMNEKELKFILSSSKNFKQDFKIKNELKTLIEKKAADITKDELMAAINNIIYLSHRYSEKNIINYSDCTNESDSIYGLKYSVVEIKNTRILKMLQEVIPNNPKDLNQFITLKMKKFKMGSLPKPNSPQLFAFEVKSLALFLALAEFGTNEQKEFVAAVRKLSSSQGRTQLFDNKNPHKFWKVFSGDVSEADVKSWTATIEDTTTKILSKKISPEEAFYKVLKEKAQNNSFLLRQLETLKSKRCFFK